MKRRPDADGYYHVPGTLHYNVGYVGGVVFNRVMGYHFFGQRTKDIEWIWIVEEKRQATRQEIAKLCGSKLLKIAVTPRP